MNIANANIYAASSRYATLQATAKYEQSVQARANEKTASGDTVKRQDTVSLSDQALEAYKAMTQTKGSTKPDVSAMYKGPGSVAMSKGYDLNRIMDIYEKGFKEVPTREESEYYWAARKADPELDQALYDQEKAKVLGEVSQIQNLLLKATLSNNLSEKEQQQIKEDPQLQQAIMVKQAEMNVVSNLLPQS